MKTMFIVMAAILLTGVAAAQTTEVYAGNHRAGVDILWFSPFRKNSGDKTPFLFFSRNRASIDYKQPGTGLLGSANAVSMNFKGGIGIVSVASFTNNGLTPKAGIQYFRSVRHFMFFGWLVADLKKNGGLDLFGLFRYTPAINEKVSLMAQVELFPVYFRESKSTNMIQRVRLGLKNTVWSGGLMADFSQGGGSNPYRTRNYGLFLRVNDFN